MKVTQNDLLVINAQKDVKIAQMEDILAQQHARIQELEKEKADREAPPKKVKKKSETANKDTKDVQ